MFDLKVCPELPHHYIIGVAIQTMRSSTPGKMYLKYGPIHFINDDVNRLSICLHLINDKIYKDIYKVKNTEIYKMYDCTNLIFSFIGLQQAANANNATLHHFSSEFEIDDADNFFKIMVDNANNSKHDLNLLMKAKIKGGV